jgi:hypothetical protein
MYLAEYKKKRKEQEKNKKKTRKERRKDEGPPVLFDHLIEHQEEILGFALSHYGDDRCAHASCYSLQAYE